MTSDANPPELALTTDARTLAGRYQLLDKVGQGGMGTVFRARDTQLGRTVAVKLLPAGKLTDAEAVARFQREARALARLSHPNIIQAYDSGQDGDDHFLVMEFVEGHSLARELAEKGRLAPTRAADYAHQAALALHHAHRNGLIHRDVKPSNLLVSRDGRVKLLDLGLARFLQDQVGDATLTREGAGLGTPDYVAPEQFRDAHRADVRSDIYSLGCTLYHLIAGRVPFPGSSLSEKLEAHVTKEPTPLEEVNPDMPAGLALVVQRMMAKRPADRFPGMAEVAEVLAPYVATSSPSFRDIRNTSTWSGTHLSTMRALPHRPRMPWVVAAGAAALLLAAVGLVGLAAGWFRGRGEAVVENTQAAPRDTRAAGRPADTGKATSEAPKPVTDPNVLTVAQDRSRGARFRTIGEALEAAKAGQTIRVLDDAVYHEMLAIRGPTEHAGITLEAVRGATLEQDTAQTIMVQLVNAPRVTVRGFRLRARNAPRSTMVVVRGDCPGLRLENLDLSSSSGATTNGIEVYGGRSHDPKAEPAVIQQCTFRHLGLAVVFIAYDPDTLTRAAVRDSLFTDSFIGAKIMGRVDGVQIVGNRFTGMSMAGAQVESLSSASKDIMIANNTFHECTAAFRLWDTGVKGEGVRLRNNLVVSCQTPDMFFIEADNPNTPRGPGDATAVAKAYSVGYNWREGRPPETVRGWIPADAKKGDVLKEKITGVNRDPKAADFLRPDAQSPLAAEGAGREDPTLPCYVGALPAEGTEPWDWDRTWRLPKDAQLLTVSKDAKDGGKYRTINDALAAVTKPWATVRVLDAVMYPETVVLDQKERHEGLLLEAPKRATLVLGESAAQILGVRGVPRIRVRGFRFRQESDARKPFMRYLVQIQGPCPGLRLEGLDFRPVAWLGAIALQNVAGSADEPVCVTRCHVVGTSLTDGLILLGPQSSASGPSRFVAVRDNRITGVLRAIHLRGAFADVQVVGNQIAGSVQEGIGIEDLTRNARGLLLANNTLAGGECGLRGWLGGHADLVAGQIEIRNSVLLDHSVGDMVVYVSADGYHGDDSAEKSRLAAERWRFGGNWRDLSGSGNLIPLAAGDHKLNSAAGLERNASRPNFLRPDPKSPLATEGAGTGDPSLPLYVGALPPEGAQAWDWDRTWRARVSRAADRK